MSYYTVFKISLILKNNLPEKIINTLKYAFNDEYYDDDEKIEFLEKLFGSYSRIPEFFKAARWTFMTKGGDNRLFLEDKSYLLEIDSEFQNRDNEIDKFLCFIRPYVDADRFEEGHIAGSIQEEAMIAPVKIKLHKIKKGKEIQFIINEINPHKGFMW